MASMALSQQARAPIKHLRTLNAYADAALGDWERKSRVQGQLPRQQAPDMASSGAHAAAGTSSFGMSGVNAHLLLTASGAAVASKANDNQVHLAGHQPSECPFVSAFEADSL